jgi:hypothetical protein
MAPPLVFGAFIGVLLASIFLPPSQEVFVSSWKNVEVRDCLLGWFWPLDFLNYPRLS